jgi:zinc protease
MSDRRVALRFLHLCLASAAAASCASATPRSPAPPPARAPTAAEVPRPDETFRVQPPAPDPQAPFVPPIPRLSTLPNGMGLMVFERHVTPLVAARLIVRGGTPAFPGEPPEVFELMADMALHGTNTRPEREIYDTMASRFFEVGASVGDGWLEFRMRSFSSSFFVALDLMHDVALDPLFSADTLEVIRQRRRAATDQHADDVDRIALTNLDAAVLGDSNPYTRFEREDLTALDKVTRDDIVRAWRESMDPTAAVLVVTGDVDAAAVRERVEVLFDGWKRDPSLRARVALPPPTPAAARLIVVDRPGVPLATVVYGAGIPPVDSPGNPLQSVVHALMGGMRSSAVTQRLRQQVDPALSGTARFRSRPGGGVTWWQNQVPAREAAPLLTALQEQVHLLHDRGPSAEELGPIKALISRALPRALETVDDLVEQLAQIAAFRFPVDQMVRYQVAIDAASPDSVRAAVPDPKAWKAIVVGDLASLREPLLALGWGPVEVRDANGRVLRTIGP